MTMHYLYIAGWLYAEANQGVRTIYHIGGELGLRGRATWQTSVEDPPRGKRGAGGPRAALR